MTPSTLRISRPGLTSTRRWGTCPTPSGASIYKKYALKEPLLTPGEKSAESRGITEITHRLNTGLRLQPEFLP